ncbi:MAG TPA: phospholipase C, phosphocholine-specific, partial [Cyclobacteriaceae bacterium]|nr:phospholipase C, phosphocholine-specific [Cyclobacteriaceae bacterium]
MDSRREFIKKAALLSGMGAVAGTLPPSIQRAFAIDPPAGTTYLDAEHVVILMQENRSFDHCFGTLRGVRGFNDPRAITLPDKKPVWCQTNEKGETFAPFRLNIKDTKATWMGSLPHSWTDQIDARNKGQYDQWLIAKKSGRKEYSHMPLTLGYYNREDLPFYYSLADAFTICDQNFCSSLTGTTPNRIFFWTGTVREDAASPARIRNEETNYSVEAQWKTFPERLEENGISWKIYQNELSVGVGFDGDQDAWLANFTDNPMEWFTQYHVKLHPAYIANLPKMIALLEAQIKSGEEKLKTLTEGTAEYTQLKTRLDRGLKELNIARHDITVCTKENFDRLSPFEKNIHQKAFTTNIADSAYHELSTVAYRDGDVSREMKVPKGDVLHQFREDVKNGTLPTVSWLVAPENFSDHPGAPWYGAWYLSETMDILTKNPEVWKKTIFILCYDENDGYFDHVPPFIPPVAGKPETGAVSPSMDTSLEFVSMEQELKRKPAQQSRESSIGLGYRVPLVIASPWSRGGNVCSQVFDHTSILMFLEKYLSQKTGKKIEETNINSWRRSVCGDLTTTFKPYDGEKINLPDFVHKTEFIESIHKAQFKDLPVTPKPLSGSELALLSKGLKLQEKGTR